MKTAIGRTVGRIASLRGGLFAALVAAAMLLSSGREAAAQVCTAALDVDIHYCLIPADCPGVNTLDLKDGDKVTLTVEVTNDSQYQNPGPIDPPAGHLQGPTAVPPSNQAIFKVFYACSASTCFAGQELANWFTFNSVDILQPGFVSYADDGNGFSGTITVTNDLAYAAHVVNNGKFLVKIHLTANQPPGTGQVFARANGSPAAFLITDPLCLPGLTGTGQGSTAAVFGGPQDILEPCQHPNKQVIQINQFGPTKILEKSTNRVAFRISPYDPSANTFTFGYEDAGGTVFQWMLAVGDLVKQAPGSYLFLDKNARNKPGGGVERAHLIQDPKEPDKWCLSFIGFGDFNASLPTNEVMWMFVSTAGKTFVGPKSPPYMQTATWKTSPANFIPPQNAHSWYLPTSAWK